MNGSITINGQERNLSQFRKLSCYIMQDNQLHANLTVEEAMHVASNLKLGKDMKKDEKQEVVSSWAYYKQLCQIEKTSRNVITCINQGIDERILLDWILKRIGCSDSSGWGCGQWWGLVNMVMNCQDLLKRRHFVTSGIMRSPSCLYVLLPLPPFKSVDWIWQNSILILYHLMPSQFHPF